MAEYNVYYHSFNNDEIKPSNVLREDGYIMSCIKEYKRDMSREEFDEELDIDCFRMYWSRCEYEVIISAWCGGKAEEKIDVYQQLKMNWNIFSEICWKLYKEIHKRKPKAKSERMDSIEYDRWSNAKFNGEYH